MAGDDIEEKIQQKQWIKEIKELRGGYQKPPDEAKPPPPPPPPPPPKKKEE